MYKDQFGEFVCEYWGLKGYKPWAHTSSLAVLEGLTCTSKEAYNKEKAL